MLFIINGVAMNIIIEPTRFIYKLLNVQNTSILIAGVHNRTERLPDHSGMQVNKSIFVSVPYAWFTGWVLQDPSKYSCATTDRLEIPLRLAQILLCTPAISVRTCSTMMLSVIYINHTEPPYIKHPANPQSFISTLTWTLVIQNNFPINHQWSIYGSFSKTGHHILGFCVTMVVINTYFFLVTN